MPRINNFPQDGSINAGDRLLGVGDLGTTYTYSLDSITGFLRSQGIQGQGVSLIYRFGDFDGGNPVSDFFTVENAFTGSFSFDTGATNVVVRLNTNAINSEDADGIINAMQVNTAVLINANGTNLDNYAIFRIATAPENTSTGDANVYAIELETISVGGDPTFRVDQEIVITMFAMAGARGITGAQGDQGRYNVRLYQRGSTAPAVPSGLTWMPDGTLTNDGGWSTTIPAGTERLWEIEGNFDPATQTQITSWSVAFEAGAEGPAGVQGPIGVMGDSLSCLLYTSPSPRDS